MTCCFCSERHENGDICALYKQLTTTIIPRRTVYGQTKFKYNIPFLIEFRQLKN